MNLKKLAKPIDRDAYAEAIPEQETDEQMWKRALRGPVPEGIAPHDQAYLCPGCGTRFIGYRRSKDFGPAIRDSPSRHFAQATCGRYECWDTAAKVHYEEQQRFFASIKSNNEYKKAMAKKEEWE